MRKGAQGTGRAWGQGPLVPLPVGLGLCPTTPHSTDLKTPGLVDQSCPQAAVSKGASQGQDECPLAAARPPQNPWGLLTTKETSQPRACAPSARKAFLQPREPFNKLRFRRPPDAGLRGKCPESVALHPSPCGIPSKTTEAPLTSVPASLSPEARVASPLATPPPKQASPSSNTGTLGPAWWLSQHLEAAEPWLASPQKHQGVTAHMTAPTQCRP